MKNVILSAALLVGMQALAQGGESATPPPAGKVSKKEAKAECLKEDAKLKGAKLAECIKGKQK